MTQPISQAEPLFSCRYETEPPVLHPDTPQRSKCDNDKPRVSRSRDEDRQHVPTSVDRTRPLLPFFHPPIELPARYPSSCLDIDRRVHFAAIRVAILSGIKIPHV